jgi:hypothetical protein
MLRLGREHAQRTPCVYIIILFAFINVLLCIFKVQREVSNEFARGTHFAFIREVPSSNFDRNTVLKGLSQVSSGPADKCWGTILN